MNVLMFSTDSTILENLSSAQKRMIEYGSLVDNLHIVVICKNSKDKTEKFFIGSNVTINPIYSANRLFALYSGFKIYKKFKNSNINIVTAQDPFETGLVGWLVSKKLKAKLQLQVHTDLLSKYFAKDSIKNHIRVLIAKWLLPKADSVRVVSQRIKKSLIDFGLNTDIINVLPIFVDVKKIQSESAKLNLHTKYPQFDSIIFMASRLTREKNISLAISSLKDVIKEYPKVGLVIVGSGPEQENLQNMAESLKLGNNVIFEAWNNELSSYFKSSDIFLNTSNYEGYGMTLVESASSGSTIITTDVGVAGDVIQNNISGVVIPIADKGLLTKSILNLLKDNDLKEKLKKGAIRAVEQLPNKEKSLALHKQLWQTL